MRGLGEKIKDVNIVQKVLRSLPVRFNSKVSALEERTNLDNLEMDELHGILIAYEMRTSSENLPRKKQLSRKQREIRKWSKVKSAIMKTQRKMWKNLTLEKI